ncbi:C4-dicarboxylate ABC transporter [Microbulbifer thermotolerans]|uniref:C4-dicarboxylate ABC transporter n=1 Tax=Microbulbifer thermotolerans TaxID=252514 RepID=A0AB35HZR5_MICTH|nr:Na+/H+ antiporter NhaC family protein [Microbulbifer thermotolerans]MCX2781652.1 C4-dicarboxylate ABC transporter [Microbulbifer thermotolerans]MCX2794811.1 C4-dicarboxylate ABC transporter [Microbulbifer thermotolerans]MCX2802281.1 C4-dicarboxylate ABC transporter [Microbulbifer thermotolerans]MCX2831002.1 C4-dicarboxylate ABC transporter [Microbulbifer thermotolerans]
MNELSWTTLLPSFLAIALALFTRQVYLALFAGIWIGYFLLNGSGFFPSLAESLDGLLAVLASPGDARVVMFTLVIGAFIYTLERSGAVRAFVQLLKRSQWVTNGKRAQWMAWLIGIVIFIESNITVLVAGTVAKPLFDHFRIAREKLAYIIDSTSAPICMLIPLNAWGAFNLGLLNGLGVEDPLKVLLASIPLNLYAITAVAISAYAIARDYNPGPMARAEERAAHSRIEDAVVAPEIKKRRSPHVSTMLIPVVTLVVAMPVGLWITGDGKIFAGSGSTSVLWASLAALAILSVMIAVQRIMTLDELSESWMNGAGRMLPMAIILVLALALGSVSKALGTGDYVVSLVGDTLPLALMPLVIFLVSALIAFSVGSSWGTFSIMLPIAVPVATAMGADPTLLVAAVLSGGIFGDHSSPISDTTIVSSLAAGSEHIEHVRTQLPYALRAGAIAAVGFVVLGFLLL